jgi:glyoxylase-like metal-dependent hydrolase (beta-lactamase superfamily II)
MHRAIHLVLLASITGCASAAPALAPAPVPVPATVPAPAPAASHRPLADGYDIVNAAPGVYAFLAHRSNTPIVTGNSVAIVGDDGVLVVDTGQFPELARRVIADLRKITDKPVRYVVNSHWHNDHFFGNAAYRDAFPGVQIVAQEETLRLMEKYGAKGVDAYKTKVAAFIDHLRAMLKDSKNDDGSPMTDFDRDYVTEEIADGVAAAPLWQEVELALPTSTFGDEQTIDLGKRVVKLLHLGRGNTAGDAMVYVPDASFLATGDAVVAPVPFGMGSYYTEWTTVLEKTKALGATTIMPGHGPIFHDTSYIDALHELFQSVVEQTRAAVAAGATKDDVQAKVDLSRFRARFAGDDPYAQKVFDKYFVKPAVDRAYQEAINKLEDE